MSTKGRTSHRIAISAGASMVVVMAAVIIGSTLGFRINTTESMPFGIWRLAPLPAQITRGMVVVACLPPGDIAAMARRRGYIGRGDCPTDGEPLLKPVAAISGDEVVVSDHGIAVNGVAIPNSAPLTKDDSGRPLSAALGTWQVLSGEVWLVSSYSPNSFDSRYFAGIPVSDIRAEARAIWTIR